MSENYRIESVDEKAYCYSDETDTLHNKRAVKSEQGEERELTNPELSQVVGGVRIVMYPTDKSGGFC